MSIIRWEKDETVALIKLNNGENRQTEAHLRGVVRTRHGFSRKPLENMDFWGFCDEENRPQIGVFGANCLFARKRTSNPKKGLSFQGFRGVSAGKM